MKSSLLALFCIFDLETGNPDEAKAIYEVTYEIFSLPIQEAANLKRENPGGKDMYARLLAGIEDKKVRQENWRTLRMSQGKNQSSESYEELIYPTEYEPDSFNPPPQVPTNPMGIPMFHPRPFPVPWLSGHFDTKKVGDSLEGELQVSRGTASLRLHTCHVQHLTNDPFGKGVSEWVMPRFSVQRLTTGVKTKLGIPTLIGTISPPKELQKRIWLAFVTIEKTENK